MMLLAEPLIRAKRSNGIPTERTKTHHHTRVMQILVYREETYVGRRRGR